MPDQYLLRNHLYNTFDLLPMTEHNDMIHDIEVEVHHEIIITTKKKQFAKQMSSYI